MPDSAPPGVLWEFSARRFLGEARGRVRARDFFEAKRRIKARGYRWPSPWRVGQTGPLGASRANLRRSTGVVPAGLKVVSQSDERLVCAGRDAGFIGGGIFLACFGLLMGGVSLFGYRFDLTRSLGFGAANWFFGGIGAFIFLFGLSVLFSRPSLVVDAAAKSILLELVLPPFNMQWPLSAADAAAIVLDTKDMMDSDLSNSAYVISVYVISVQMADGEQWPVDASSNHAAQLELAEAIAKCLKLPLLDYGDQPSPT